ncbi:S-phase kinase-associated protein 1 [Tupaia chinensis]|uniref:S-phase kinase-associated protein 1 n=1 Tax=Tupaia chinensis TaxID=246437 RepID=L9JP42_TUPCH|nr:S-phase kinase-associated protein 1 [Tupaia chinensis]
MKLQSSDGGIFEVDVEIAKQSVTIKPMLGDSGIEDEGDDDPVHLPNVNAAIFKKVIQWCTHHKDDSPPPEDDENKLKRTDDIPVPDQGFPKVDQGTLFALLLAANYLGIKDLLDVTCNTVANMIKGKTVPRRLAKTTLLKRRKPRYGKRTRAPASRLPETRHVPLMKLQSSDGGIFEVDVEIAKQSVTIKPMLGDSGIEDEGDDDPVPLPNVNAAIFKKVIQWCTHHKDDSPPPEDDENKLKRTDDIPVPDQGFPKVDQGTLFALLLAANYLGIKDLLDVTCNTVANMIKGKTVPRRLAKTTLLKRRKPRYGKRTRGVKRREKLCLTP